MENTAKAILIAASILLAIVIVSCGVVLVNRNIASAKINVDSSNVKLYDQIYTMYEGKQIGSVVKQLLTKAAENNKTLYKSKDTIDECVCIRSKSNKILKKITNKEFLRGLNGSRSYGVRYPDNIYQLIDIINSKEEYNISFTYNEETGNIWEIWIN